MKFLKRFLGPRVPKQLTDAERKRFRLPSLLLGTAAVFLIISIFLPYWKMALQAPQYPNGLEVTAYVNRLTGDVFEIDGLNHYIGMRPLEEAAQLERSVSVAAITIIAMLVLSAIIIHTKWAALLVLPALLMPYIFLADMYFWMRNFGLNLDPRAPLSNAIEPFVPPIWGEGVVGQFKTVAAPQSGLYLAMLSGVVILGGLWFHRRAYKPLVEQAS